MAVIINGDSVITSPLTIGFGAGNLTGNTAVGTNALQSNTTGNYSTAIGNGALSSNTTGRNIALGTNAAVATTTGTQNTAIGDSSLYTNTTGSSNTAVGWQALFTNTASNNTAVGQNALQSNTTGTPNDAFGYQALFSNTTGALNVAIGYQSLYSNTTGQNNTAIGAQALVSNTIGVNNTSLGYGAGYPITTGNNNVLIGQAAGWGGGVKNLTTGSQNVLIGQLATASSAGATNQIVIGYTGIGQGDNYVTIGVGGTNYIYNQFSVNATWTKASDERIKRNIADLDIGLDFVKELKVKQYNWKPSNELPEDIIGYSEENTQNLEATMYGMIAQDVKAAMDKHGYEHFGGWNVREADGLQGLSNEMFVLPLINAVKELSAKVEALEAQLAAKA